MCLNGPSGYNSIYCVSETNVFSVSEFHPYSVLKRMCNLISKEATLIASNQASVKQAQGASDQAKRLMDEMDELQKVSF